MPDFIGDDESMSSGSQFYWDLQGASNREAFAYRVNDAGLGKLGVPKVSEMVALKRAVDKVYKNARTRIERLDRRRFTVHVIHRDAEHGQVSHEQTLTCELGPNGPEVRFKDGTVGQVPALREQWEWFLDHLTTEDMNGWVRKVMDAVGAVVMRSGVYFVPKRSVPLIQSVKKILETLGHSATRLPLMRSEDVTAAVLRGLADEAAVAMADTQKYLDTHTEVSDRGRIAQSAALDVMRQKIASYETIFAMPMTEMVGKIQELKNKLAGVFFKSEAAMRGQSVAEGERMLELDDRHVSSTPPIDDSPVRPLELN